MKRTLLSSRCLFEHGGKAAIVDIPFNYSAADWSRVMRAFLVACKCRPSLEDPAVWTLYADQEHFGIPYSWGLHSADGSWFVVHHFPEHSEEDVKRCRDKICAEQDVAQMRVCRVKEWVKLEIKPLEVTMA